MLNMRKLLVVSVALFVLCSSVNMVPDRSSLESFKKDVRDKTKRQEEQYCLDLFQPCIDFDPFGCIFTVGYECFRKIKKKNFFSLTNYSTTLSRTMDLTYLWILKNYLKLANLCLIYHMIEYSITYYFQFHNILIVTKLKIIIFKIVGIFLDFLIVFVGRIKSMF